MEGILPSLPWTVPRRTLPVPYVAEPSYQPTGTSFEHFLQLYGIQRTNSVKDLIDGYDTIGRLTTFLQTWLFFGLLSTFLQSDINQTKFVAKDLINVDNEAVHGYFRDWRVSMSRLSYNRRRIRHQKNRALLNQASLQSDIFEEAADCLAPKDDNFDRVIISIRLLISLLSAMLDDTFALISPPQSKFWAPWVSILASCLPRVLPFPKLPSFKMPDEYISNSLAVLGDQEARRHLRSQPNKSRPFPPGVQVGGRAAGLLLNTFTNNGWCPYRARELCRTYDYLILNSMASVQIPDENHQRCLESQRCSAHDLDVEAPDQYLFQHTVSGSHDCEQVSVPRDQIANIIMSNQIPLISLSLEGDLDLQVVQCTPYTTYTAISHVWSDGLGNPGSNALPRCQLFRLRKLISETYFAKYSPFYDDSTVASRMQSTMYWEFWRATSASRPHFKIEKKRVYFWMDTLCIPVSMDPHKTEDLKFRAMKHITPIFAGAFTTLVLDRGLERLVFPNASRVSGDELAAVILSSKWMLRGWTLEEGALSSTCTFQIMDKPYEMSGSLNYLLPKLESSHSPLERASTNVRRLVPLVLRRGLLDEKKRLSQDPLASRAMRLTKLLRVPQFTWTWNSLLQRSVTKMEDGPIILANLLDFNVSGLKYVPEEERLKLLIQNCDELPLSLLYNTGARISVKGHPELGWIPQSISGDHIVSGASLRRIATKRNDEDISFYIDRQDSDPESFLVLGTASGQCIGHELESFIVRTRNRRHGDIGEEYIVEVQRSRPPGSNENSAQVVGSQIYQQPQGTCLAMELVCGTPSRSGFLAKGVQFNVDSYRKGHMVLKYEAPLIIWSLEQWCRKYNRDHTSLSSFDMSHVSSQQRLLLQYDASLWGPRLVRRPFHTQHPLGAKLTGMFIFGVLLIFIVLCLGYLFVTIREALGFRPGPSPHSSVVISIFGPILTMFVYDPIRRRLAMYAYISWLKSFNDGYVGPKRRRARVMGSVRRLFKRGWMYWRGPPRGISQVSISLDAVRRQQGDIENDFPSEIFLE